MECKNCKANIENTNFCLNCGVDIVLFEKTFKVSNILYNKGLYQIKSKNFMDAIETLNRSIYFNKNNYNARNLLGLIYFEVGRVGEALKHWIISTSIKKDDNFASKYIKIIEENEKEIDILNDAVEMYNYALTYIHQKNDDMAVIQLKKSIELNPNFIDAMNLLSFCYLIQNKKEDAESLILKVLKKDENNSIALYYYRELFPNESRPKSEPNIVINKVEPKSLYSTYTTSYKRLTPEDNKKKFGNNFHFTEIISFIIGGICIFVLMYTLIIPENIDDKKNQIMKLETNLHNLEKKHNNFILDSEEKIKNLEEENSKLILENRNFKDQINLKKMNGLIKEADTFYVKGKYENAIELLSEVDENILDDEQLKYYIKVKDKVYKTVGQNYYNRGVREYRKKNYDSAKKLLEESFKYSKDDVSYIVDEIYYLGKIAEINGDKALALEYYKKIVEVYPNSNKAKFVSQIIKSLE